MAVDAYSVAERARELCYQTSVLHDLVGELQATAETACQQAQVARHEARERRQVVKCHRYLRRSADGPRCSLPARVPPTPPVRRDRESAPFRYRAVSVVKGKHAGKIAHHDEGDRAVVYLRGADPLGLRAHRAGLPRQRDQP